MPDSQKDVLDDYAEASNDMAGKVAVAYTLLAALVGIAASVGFMIGARYGCGA